MNLFQKLLAKLIKKSLNKSSKDAVANTDVKPKVPEVEPITVPGDNSKKDTWKFILQTLISILTAILTALGASSCVSHM